MPSTISTGLSARGLNGTFFPKFNDVQTLWRMICTIIKSGGASEIYRWLGQLPMPTEWRGERKTQALRDFGMTIANTHWESTLAIDRDELADEQVGQLTPRVGEMARRFATHPDKVVIDLILAAEAALCYDGQYFFDTDHAEGASGTQSNDLTSSAVSTTAPTAAEFKAAFWAAIKALTQFKDDQGEPWNLFSSFEQMDGLLVVVPPPFLQVASEVLGANAAPIISSTSNILAGRSKVITNARLTWTTKFAVLKVDDEMKPFIFQERQPVKTELKDDPEKKDILYMADGRYGVGYGAWQKAVLVTFT